MSITVIIFWILIILLCRHWWPTEQEVKDAPDYECDWRLSDEY